ncbi:MAG: undecaprenyl/decaprenyl-phosphate alpha-N-acetylglucosaminyl 1-phosphate transferase [Oligosphaeraceae bacterium]|nr:undecaprenyl/decaprenyl-phosphate alpha-N-acetylglucosaminyl 1-phosphate transferase [Oligosphaeraceae bacterium]
MIWPIIYLSCLVLSTIFSALSTWQFCRLAPKLGLLDRPRQEQHKTHAQATAVSGGLGMFLAWLLSILTGLLAGVLVQARLPEEFAFVMPGLQQVWKSLVLIICIAGLYTLLGAYDDKYSMPASKKFLGQFVLAGISAWFGPRLGLGLPCQFICWLVSVFWIMGVVNAMNFFDNMDGLAAGTALIAAVFLLLVAAYRAQHFVALLAALGAGVSLGFLFHNRPPAKVFMGDSGSHFLGYCLAVTCILTTFYVPSESLTYTPVLIPLLILAIPLFDAVVVVIIRQRLGQPFYVGDNRHISHRFTKLGLSRPYAVLLVCLLCFISGTGALTLLWLPPTGVALIFAQTAAMLAVVTIIQFHVPENKQ